MSYLVLARKWRPQRFDEVVGQRHVALTLTSALATQRLSHAYLFAGPRGVGKTSMARILAKALNCERGPAVEPCNECAACRAITEGHCLDVLEIDGASNRGIDDVRQLREGVKYAPASVRAKVYIIDEVHMLTTDAFNALLKTLEEPPAHVTFVLATTEPLRVPATILSRCQRHDFGRLTVAELAENLRRIVTAEGIAIDDEALRLIARKSEGSVRDSLTLLDQVAASGAGPFEAARVQEILGLAGSALTFEISDAIVHGDGRRALLGLDRAYREGLNLQELAEELVTHFRDLLLVCMDAAGADGVDATAEEAEELRRQAADARPADALRWLRILLDTGPRMRRSPHARVHLEVALAEMAALPRAVELARVLESLRAGSGSETAVGAPPSGRLAAAPRQPPAPAQARGAAAAGVREVPRGGAGRTGACAQPAGGVPAAQEPAAHEPAAGDAGTAAGAEPGSLSGDWERVLSQMRRGRAFLASCLHESAALRLDGGRLLVRLEDPNGFKREQLEQPANRRYILRTIEEVFGAPLGIRLIDASEAAALDATAGGADAAGAPAGVGGDPAASMPRARPAAAQPEKDAQGAGRRTSGADRVREIADLMDGDIVGPAR